MESPNVSHVLLLASYSNQESHGQVCHGRNGRYEVIVVPPWVLCLLLPSLLNLVCRAEHRHRFSYIWLLSDFYFSLQAPGLEFPFVSIKSDDSYALLRLATRDLDTQIPISQSKPATDIYSETFAQSAVNCFYFGQSMETVLVIQTELEEDSTISSTQKQLWHTMHKEIKAQDLEHTSQLIGLKQSQYWLICIYLI